MKNIDSDIDKIISNKINDIVETQIDKILISDEEKLKKAKDYKKTFWISALLVDAIAAILYFVPLECLNYCAQIFIGVATSFFVIAIQNSFKVTEIKNIIKLKKQTKDETVKIVKNELQKDEGENGKN